MILAACMHLCAVCATKLMLETDITWGLKLVRDGEFEMTSF